jgi:hypothetical protein
MRKRPLTPEQHRDLARELADVRQRLQGATEDLVNRYGKTGRVGRAARRLERSVDSLRCALDGQLLQDHPEQFDPTVYYPGQGQGGAPVRPENRAPEGR